MSKYISFASITLLALLVLPVFANAQQDSCSTNTAIYGTPGNYTFTVPAGVTALRIFVSGGGGGGGAGSGGWGSGGGGACGGAIAGGTMAVTPGQQIPLYVGYGGTGGNGTNQKGAGGCPWCGTYDPSSNGSAGGTSGIGSITATGGSWGRTGFYNLYNDYAGGSGGGSGGGGGGNGWPGFYGASGNGGTAGGGTNSDGSGGYCTGGGWSIDPGTFITNVSYSAGAGGYAPGNYSYWGGGGGGGVVINSSTVKGGDGSSSPNNGGKGYGGGGGGSNVDYQGPGGTGAPGVVYIEWDNNSQSGSSCALSCSVTFDQNPLTSNSTTVHWTSQNASLFYINNIGYVSGSGQTQVFGAGDYSGYASGIGDSVSCPAILSGNSNNQCTPTSQSCNLNGTVVDSCGNTTVCRYGCSIVSNQCNTSDTCQASNVCDAEGNKVVSSCDGSTVEDCAAEGKMCAAGQCVLPTISFDAFSGIDFTGKSFNATGHLLALPSLVPQGSTTHLYWNVGNATGCTLTGSNGDGLTGAVTGLWNTLTSGASGKTTSPITEQTTYTLSCTALAGAIPASVTEQTTINVVPVFLER